jgi:DNA-binding NtrC family response regulator
MERATQDFRKRELRVLLIEDSEPDAELTIRRLKAAGFNCSYRCVVNERDMRRELKACRPDLILSDFSIPGFNGMSALAIARVEAAGVPFIFLSGTIGEERAIEALKCGAIDYVLKTNPMRLVPAVERALAEAELRRTSQIAEQQVARLTGVLQMLSGINAALVRIAERDLPAGASRRRLRRRHGGADQSDHTHGAPGGMGGL